MYSSTRRSRALVSPFRWYSRSSRVVAAAGARADEFDDAQAALEQAAAQAGGAPSPAAPAPVKKVEAPKKSWDSSTGGVAAPSAAPEAPSNVNISIRVQSPGNDGPVV